MAIYPFALGIVIKEEHIWIGRVRPTESLLDISGSFTGLADAGPVIPDRAPELSIFIQCLVDHVPGEDFSSIVLDYFRDVIP